MQDKFSYPKTLDEFKERVGPITINGAKAVVKGLDQKLRKATGTLIDEKAFFEEAIAYKESGATPERYNNNDGIKKTP